MSREAYRTLVFGRLELEILLNLSGCSRLYGFFGEADKKASKEEVYLAVAALIEKEWLIECQGKMIVSQTIKGLLDEITISSCFLKIISNIEKQQEYICYFANEKVVVSSCSAFRENAVTLVEMKKEVFFCQFFADLLPDISERQNSAQEFGWFEEILLECEIWKNKRKCCKNCLINDMGNLYILIERENQRIKKTYQPEVFESILKEIISEVKHDNGRSAGAGIG